MITAKEALQMTLAARDAAANISLETLENEIIQSAKNGKIAVFKNGILRFDIKQALEEYGYEVSFGNQYGMPYYNIIWGK